MASDPYREGSHFVALDDGRHLTVRQTGEVVLPGAVQFTRGAQVVASIDATFNFARCPEPLQQLALQMILAGQLGRVLLPIHEVDPPAPTHMPSRGAPAHAPTWFDRLLAWCRR